MNSTNMSSVMSTPCAPFCSGQKKSSRMHARRVVIKNQASNRDAQDKANTMSKIGKICAPIAAAALLMVQGAPAMANPVTDTFENTLKRQQELGADKLDFASFFNKGKEAAKGAVDATKDASDPSKAAINVPKEIPTFGKPIETSSSVGKIAQDAKNKLDPTKKDTAAQKVKETVSGIDDKAPGEDSFRKTAKEGTKDNTGAGSNSNSQASAAPAYADKQEQAALDKAEKFQQKAESGNPDRPRLDPSLVEGEPEPGPAPGVSNKLPEQPKPEKGTFEQLGRDSSGGKVQDSKSKSPLDPFGGGPSGETATSKAETLIEKAEQPNQGNVLDFIQKGLNLSSSRPTNDLGSLADLPAPQPTELDEPEPQAAPGEPNKLPEQPRPEPESPQDLGKDSAGGKTGSTKSGGGILDFFGGSSNNQSAAPQPKSGVTLASSTFSQNSGFVYLLADADLPPPQPTELDEPEPEAAPGEPNTLPDQPRPEPASQQVGKDSSGGETQDTKRGSGPLDFFGGSDSGDSDKAADSNVAKAASNDVGSVSSAEIAQVSEEEASGADDGKATLIGVGLSIALEIAIFSTYPSSSHAEKH